MATDGVVCRLLAGLSLTDNCLPPLSDCAVVRPQPIRLVTAHRLRFGFFNAHPASGDEGSVVPQPGAHDQADDSTRLLGEREAKQL